MTIEIIKNYELPAKRRQVGSSVCKYPFAAMEVGDGFEIPDDGELTNSGNNRLRTLVSAAAFSFCKLFPSRKFSTRKIRERGVIAVKRVK